VLAEDHPDLRTQVAVRPRPALETGGIEYGVGLRVFTDRRLLRQIRDELVGGAMRLEEIAILENVTPDALVALLEERLAGERESGLWLHRLAASLGFQVTAWRRSRHHPSRLHVLDAEGVLCGASPGSERSAIHSGPCLSCAQRLSTARTRAGTAR
jgi:hypothetical protein